MAAFDRPIVRDLYERQYGACFYCNAEVLSDQLSLDHYIPKSKVNGVAGKRSISWHHERGNLVLACIDCNTLKKSRIPSRANNAKYRALFGKEPPTKNSLKVRGG